MRTAPPPRRPNGRPNRGPLPARLLPIEQTLHILLTHPGEWHVVDRHTKSSSALSAALRRRGCDVVARLCVDEYVFWARWTHEVPQHVAPWEEPA